MGGSSYLWVGEVSGAGGVRAAAEEGMGGPGGSRGVAMERNTRRILMDGGAGGVGVASAAAARGGA